MAGIKGASGGHNKKSIARHMAEGTYRKDRHGVPMPVIGGLVCETLTGYEVEILGVSEAEKEISEKLKIVMGKIQPRMIAPFEILVHNLALYKKIHENMKSPIIKDKKDNLITHPLFVVRERVVRQINVGFSQFAMSYSEQAIVMDVVSKIDDRMNKPTNPGKPLE